jgi:general secretion pathway protein D
LGIQWGTKSDGIPNLVNDTDFSTLTGGLGIGFIHHASMQALVSALARDGSTNILSTPTIVVMDNNKADIKVGQNVPFVTGSYSTNSTGSLNNPYTITKRDFVGLELKVTPQINRGNSVRFTIEQGNESISEAGNDSQTNPITDESSVKTSVLIDNGEILVLGGLISKQMSLVAHKVPVVGDLPGIGLLFQDKQRTMQKKNLMVFLRPVVLRSRKLSSKITARKYNYTRRQELEKLHHTAMISDSPNEEGPGVLPAWQHQANISYHD